MFEGGTERLELRLEVVAAEPERVRMPVDVFGRRRRRLPGVVVSADLSVTRRAKARQDVRRLRIHRDRIGRQVGRAHAVALEELVQNGEPARVAERLVTPRRGIPLVVPFGVDANEQRRSGPCRHRSWSESPRVTCHLSVDL